MDTKLIFFGRLAFLTHTRVVEDVDTDLESLLLSGKTGMPLFKSKVPFSLSNARGLCRKAIWYLLLEI